MYPSFIMYKLPEYASSVSKKYGGSILFFLTIPSLYVPRIKQRAAIKWERNVHLVKKNARGVFCSPEGTLADHLTLLAETDSLIVRSDQINDRSLVLARKILVQPCHVIDLPASTPAPCRKFGCFGRAIDFVTLPTCRKSVMAAGFCRSVSFTYYYAGYQVLLLTLHRNNYPNRQNDHVTRFRSHDH